MRSIELIFPRIDGVFAPNLCLSLRFICRHGELVGRGDQGATVARLGS